MAPCGLGGRDRMVRVGPLATGAVFIALFIGFELQIPAITNLLPGGYGGLSYTGYLGLGFLLSGITSLSAAFAGSGMSRMRSGSDSGGGAGRPDMAAMVAAMTAAQQAQRGSPAGAPPGSVFCAACGRANASDAKFCQGCSAPVGPPAPRPS